MLSAKDYAKAKTYIAANQLWHARELLRTKGPAALTNPHAMIGRTCKCNDCFCCAAAYVMDHEYKGFWNKPRAA